MSRLLLLVLLLSVSVFGFSQINDLSSPERYITLIIENEISPETESEITSHFSSIQGIKTSRMDRLNNLFFCIYTSNSSVNEQIILNWFNNHFTVKCYFEAPYLSGSTISLNKNTCE